MLRLAGDGGGYDTLWLGTGVGTPMGTGVLSGDGGGHVPTFGWGRGWLRPYWGRGCLRPYVLGTGVATSLRLAGDGGGYVPTFGWGAYVPTFGWGLRP